MNSLLLAQAIKFLAELILGSDVFNRVLATVQRWQEKELSGAEKQAGVKKELTVIGINLAGSLTNLAIELAVAYVGYKAGNNEEPTKNEVIKDVEHTTANTVQSTLEQ